MDLHRADRPDGWDPLSPATPIDVCLERYPRDLGRALMLAESGHVSAGHAVLFTGLLEACALAHEPLQHVYEEALTVYESRYGVARH